MSPPRLGMAYGFTIDSLRIALGESVFMGYADRDKDRLLGAEDEAGVNRAIDDACSEADSYISSNHKYTVPLDDSHVTDAMRRHLLRMIVFHMHPVGRPVTEDVKEDYARAVRWFRDVGCSKAQLGVIASEPPIRRVNATRSGPAPKFTRTNLRDLV